MSTIPEGAPKIDFAAHARALGYQAEQVRGIAELRNSPTTRSFLNDAFFNHGSGHMAHIISRRKRCMNVASGGSLVSTAADHPCDKPGAHP